MVCSITADLLEKHDYVVVMAMPYMGKAEKSMQWLENLIQEIARQPDALQKAIFVLQSIDWNNSKKIDSHILASQMKLLQSKGALNFGYYPDDFLNDSPSFDVIRPFFSLQTFPFSKN